MGANAVAGLTLYPAIDIKDGRAVRLLRGAMDEATVYNGDPAGQARAFAEAGCRWLHLVDLNGAFAGRPVNAETVRRILETVSVPIQLGGGIREMDTIAYWLGLGVARIVLGTAALRAPELVKDACRAYPGRIAVGIDAREGRVAVEGWAETSEVAAEDLARRFEDVGAAAIVFTDIARDGTMQGVDLKAVAALAETVDIPVIASGGVKGHGDLQALARAAAAARGRIEGAILGRALYDGRIDLARALTEMEAAC